MHDGVVNQSMQHWIQLLISRHTSGQSNTLLHVACHAMVTCR